MTYQEVNARLWHDFGEGSRRPTASRPSGLPACSRRWGWPDRLWIRCGLARPISIIWERAPQLFPDALTLLDALVGNVHLALITNGLTRVQRARLAHSGLNAYFEAVVISEEEGVAKPEPGIFAVIFGRMGHPQRSEVLMIGDSLTSDIRGANRYGIDACWYNPRRLLRDPDAVDPLEIRYEITNLLDLVPIVLGGKEAEE